MVGKTLGHYEILEPLGAGGMGEVYRARDTKLDRDVAIKVLPEDFASNPDRLARFEREAKLLASLNHANIAAIYGLEDEGDQRFIAMELVEGETLAERIFRSGRIEVEEALEIARQIAEALEAAHENGVIHRDLKPANVIVTPDGKAKVLDFGLAKAYEADGSLSDISPDLSNSPTVAAATRTGVILGTAAYMSPEQAKGKVLDKRTDIWSFGCLLYEMLTAQSAYGGEDVSETLAAILKDEPDWTLLPADTPALAESVLRRCLRKDPDRRLHDVADVRIEIDEALHEPLADSLSVRQERTFRRRSIEYALGGVTAGLVVGLLAAFWFGSTILREEPEGASSGRQPTTAGVVQVADGARVAYGTAAIGYASPLITVSPDGKWLVYVGESEGQSRLYRQDLGRFEEAEPIPGTEGAIYAFFSPNGQSVGFLTDEQMKRVSPHGDDLQTICDVRVAVRASWTNDDWIYFAENEGTLLRRVAASASGGAIEEVADLPGTLSDVDPDGTMALYSVRSRGISSDYGAVHLLDLETTKDEVLLESGYDARFLPTGHLVFGRGGNLLAVRFDAAARQVVGDPITVVRNVAMDSLFSHVQVAVSAAGTLAYLAGGDRAIGRIASVDRQGQERFLPLEPRLYGVLDLAPDDKRLAFHVGDVNDSVWIYDPERDERRELTGGGIGGWPVWNHRGDTIAFASGLSGQLGWELKTQRIDGGAPARTVFTGNRMNASDWSPVGDVIAINDRAIGQPNIGFLTINEQPSVQWIDSPGATQGNAAFSPDGNWFAYASDQTGQPEIWVSSRHDASTERQVSLDGGLEPVWCQCNEIFFRRGNQWLAAAVLPGSELDWESPREVFEVDDYIDTPGVSYDVSSDGQLLYVVKRAEPAVRSRIQVLSNWFDDLERLVPTEVRR